jgi:predicted ATPase
MITRFRVQNYKALRDVTLNLTPIHVLIGPNDSGKTSLLEAMIALRWLLGKSWQNAFPGRWQGCDLVWRDAGKQPLTLGIEVVRNGVRTPYEMSFNFLPPGRGVQYASMPPIPTEVMDSIVPLQSYRWIPSHLAFPVAFSRETRFAMDSSGFGLALLLADILSYDHNRYSQLETRFQEFFSDVRRIRLVREDGCKTPQDLDANSPGYGIYFELMHGGQLLPASQASDGLLLVLAYLAVLYSPKPPCVLLVEEPENGIHPRRLAEVLGVLKELVRDHTQTQVLLTTHSPYVVDLFSPEEVTLCLKEADGAVTAHRLSESKAVRDHLDIFQLGEIWTAKGDETLATAVGQD